MDELPNCKRSGKSRNRGLARPDACVLVQSSRMEEDTVALARHEMQRRLAEERCNTQWLGSRPRSQLKRAIVIAGVEVVVRESALGR